MPKALLDPRRPTIPTAEDRQEQLVPYTPQLALAPMSYVTYNKTVLSVVLFTFITITSSGMNYVFTDRSDNVLDKFELYLMC